MGEESEIGSAKSCRAIVELRCLQAKCLKCAHLDQSFQDVA